MQIYLCKTQIFHVSIHVWVVEEYENSLNGKKENIPHRLAERPDKHKRSCIIDVNHTIVYEEVLYNEQLYHH